MDLLVRGPAFDDKEAFVPYLARRPVDKPA